MFNKIKLNTNDEYYTPKIAWENIAQYLPRDKVIWESFYSPHAMKKMVTLVIMIFLLLIKFDLGIIFKT